MDIVAQKIGFCFQLNIKWQQMVNGWAGDEEGKERAWGKNANKKTKNNNKTRTRHESQSYKNRIKLQSN